MAKKRKNNLKGTEIVLTFDGGLKSQFDIAYPILKKRGLKAFWFPYTCVFENKPAMIELCHDFRFCCYSNVNDFYNDFFSSVINNYISLDEYHYHKKKVEEFGYYNWGNFYTFEDRMFKYFRDEVLKQELFDNIISLMMKKKGIV